MKVQGRLHKDLYLVWWWVLKDCSLGSKYTYPSWIKQC